MLLAVCRLTPSDGGSKTTFQCLEDEASLIPQLVRNPPAVQETLVQSLGWEDPLEKGKATHASILAWRTPRTI